MIEQNRRVSKAMETKVETKGSTLQILNLQYCLYFFHLATQLPILLNLPCKQTTGFCYRGFSYSEQFADIPKFLPAIFMAEIHPRLPRQLFILPHYCRHRLQYLFRFWV